jgi:hypothetical protein
MSSEVRPTPPPPPGPGLVWIRYQDFVEEQVQAALRWFEGVIKAERDAAWRRAMERDRLRMQTLLAATVRIAYVIPPQQEAGR